MRYTCLVHFDVQATIAAMSPAEQRQLDIDSLAYDEELKANGNLVVAEALQPPENAVLVRVRNGAMSATDGPFIETKEQLAGFVLIEARDLNDAVRIAAGIPLAKYGTIEVRAMYEIPQHEQPAG